MFNLKRIKPYKGRVVRIRYEVKRKVGNETKTYLPAATGEITAATRDSVLFRIQKEDPEIMLKYPQIKEIEVNPD